MKKNKILLLISLFTLLCINAQDSIYIYHSGQIVNALKKDQNLEISFESLKGTTQDTLYIMKDGIMIYFESLKNIDSITFHNSFANTLDKCIAADDRFELFNAALEATGLDAKIRGIKDYTFNPANYPYLDPNIQINGNNAEIPESRLLGYTALMESDSVFSANSIITLEDLIIYSKNIYDAVFPEDANVSDLTNSKNSLYRFVAYHIIEKKLTKSNFIEFYFNSGHQIKTYDMFEYLETLAQNTLLEVRTHVETNEYTLFNMLGNDASKSIKILPSNYDNLAVNGVYHGINGIITYNTNVHSMISGKRLRIDVASLLPELTNNNFRESFNKVILIPNDYCKYLSVSDNTRIQYSSADQRYENYQGDVLNFKGDGLPEITIKTFPIPPGNYEVRIGYNYLPSNFSAEISFDNQKTDIVDLSLNAFSPSINYERPGVDPEDPEGLNNDKVMRNNGYMKAPSSFAVVNPVWFNAENARMSRWSLRKILGQFIFGEYSKHTIGIKATSSSGQLDLDYIEFIPVNSIENEGID